LFVLSHDCGELSNALYFLRGGSFDGTLLLPERLAQLNRDGLPVRHAVYRSAAEVLEVATGQRFDAVFLFSAYLYAINGLMAVDEVHELVSTLGATTHPVATSDPFLGLMADPQASSFRADHPLRNVFLDHFRRLSPAVRELTHVYLMPPDRIGVPRRMSFANPRPNADTNTAPRWLFLLSAEDYAFQAGLLGSTTFHATLCRLLETAAAQGRQPVLIAPQACLDGLAATQAGIEGLLALPFCTHEAFERFLLEAEYLFTWNVFTNSILARLSAGLPVFFLGRGHLAHALPALYEAGVRHYFPDCELPYLDPRSELDAGRLAARAGRQALDFAAAHAAFHAQPTPEALVVKLLEAGLP
jgi:hypothetical protein